MWHCKRNYWLVLLIMKMKKLHNPQCIQRLKCTDTPMGTLVIPAPITCSCILCWIDKHFNIWTWLLSCKIQIWIIIHQYNIVGKKKAYIMPILYWYILLHTDCNSLLRQNLTHSIFLNAWNIQFVLHVI